MSLEAIVKAVASSGLDRVAEQIEQEYKAEVRSKIKDKALSSGDAEGSIHIEAPDTHTRLIGSDHPHLFFFEMGNDQKYTYFGGKANPDAPNYTGHGARLLRFRDGTRHVFAHTYKGRHCNAKVAERHGG